MQKIRCTACNARLKLPDSFSRQTVKCPKCGVTFAANMDTNDSPGIEEGSVNEPDFDFPLDDIQPVQGSSESTDANVPVSEKTQLTSARTERAGKTAARNLVAQSAVFDFQFKRFWTPWIIRVSWYTVLIFATLWIVFLTAGFVGSFFGGQQSSMLDNFGLSDLSLSSLDIEGALSGKADVASLNKFLDGVTESGGSPGRVAAKPKTFYQSLMSYGFTILSFLTLIASSILSVLFCRVFFETIIAVFDISKSLKNIEQKIE